MAQLEPLMQRNFIEYASYVIVDRAIPDLRDGLKPVQRRILHTLRQIHDGKFHKVANVIGEAMKLHPHGDASIGDALVVLANKEYFIERQGNFGNPLTGHKAAAARYIECRLTPLALETLFNKHLTEFVPSYDGRKEEPVFLPAKLPVILLLGTEGIAVGMATKILPHNFAEVLRAQVAVLRKKRFQLQPDFFSGGLADVSEYEDGFGKVRVRAKIEPRGEKHVVIRELPYSVTTESLIASIEAAAQKGKVKIGSIHDYTAERVEIELTLPRGIYADEVIPQLYAYTDCETSLSSNIMVIHERQPEAVSVTGAVKYLTERLRQTVKAELEHDLARLQDRQHWLTLEQIFIENRVYKRIEKARTEKKVRDEVRTGMDKFSLFFVRPLVEEDIDRLLEIRIRRISAYDIEKNRKEIEEVEKAIAAVKRKLRNLTRTTIAYLEDLLKRYEKQFPRRTKITTFDTVDKKAVARQHLKVSYDPNTGFFGTQVRGKEHTLAVSEYDRILVISNDGSYRILTAPEKVLISGKLLYCALFDEEEGAEFTVVYRDKEKTAFGKRVHIHKFIQNKEYHLIRDKKGKVDVLTQDEDPGLVHLKFVPKPRQKLKEAQFDLAELDLTGVTARGKRLAPKPVARVKRLVRQ